MEQQAVAKQPIDEQKVIQTIILGSDWQQVMITLVAEEGMDPQHVDIIKLTDAFTNYLQRLKNFDFRIPARFVLIAAILLRMKCEILLEEEEKKITKEVEQIPPLNIESIPMLPLPAIRKPTHKVTLTELVSALNKAFEFQEKKESKTFRMRQAVETLISPQEHIEQRIERIFKMISAKKTLTFTELVPIWNRHNIVDSFIPLLHLMQRDKIRCDQQEMFHEITIQLLEEHPEVLHHE
ncbi:MAG: segregation/condensation protein A [Candidatus Aenigmarchaeota archaeon]|nr:segregation/condensation protein A [Candidatus Aenigmarchaeota archaeon]